MSNRTPRSRKTLGDVPKGSHQLDLPVSSNGGDDTSTLAATPIILRHLAPAKVSEVYESYWRFAAERQAVFFRRASGEPWPWTDNVVLGTYKFTNHIFCSTTSVLSFI